MTGIITLTVAGIDSGPFNLYSDVDGYFAPFATYINKSILVAGYPTDQIPDGSTIVRILSVNDICSNYIDVLISFSTTTTTTTI